ncbi:MAG: AraC family transcriptional regulator [Geminicoccaceae bacterium]
MLGARRVAVTPKEHPDGKRRAMIFRTTDHVTAEGAAERGRRMFRHEPYFALAPAAAAAMRVDTAWLDQARLCRVRSTGHEVHLAEPENATVLMPRRGRLEVVTAQGSFTARPGETLLFTPNARQTRVQPDRTGAFECDCVLLPKEASGTTPGSPLAKGRPAAVERAFGGAATGRADASLRRYVSLLVSDATQQGSFLQHATARRAAAALLDEIIGGLIEHALEEETAGPVASPSDERLVRRAEDLMLASLGEPLSVRELAAMLGTSVRRLQYAFQRVRGTTARARLGEFRLDRARLLLTDPNGGSSVTEIALDCGVSHFGRFAAAYAARYGEMPSVTRQDAIRR